MSEDKDFSIPDGYIVEHYTDIRFSIAWKCVDRYEMNFRIWRHDGLRMMPYGVESIPYSLDGVPHYAHGWVKWDGCSNWEIDEQNRGYLHFCDKQGLTDLGQVLARCWDKAQQTLPAAQE